MDIGEAKEKIIKFSKQKFLYGKIALTQEQLKDIQDAIEVVLKELDRMQEEISERIKLKVENERLVDKEFIYKGKIREKIENLKSYIYTGENAPQDFLQYRVKTKIQAYKELLEEE